MRHGFTLIELIIVIGIIAVIAAATFVAIDPARRLHEARNSTRWSDVTSVTEAVKKYQADNNGTMPATSVAIDTTAASVQVIGESVGACGSLTCSGQTVISTNCGISGLDTDLAPYLSSIPFDPQTGSANDTRYFVNQDSNRLLTIGSCDEEREGAGGAGDDPNIEVTR